MKRILCLSVVLLMIFSANAFARPLEGQLEAELLVDVEVLSFAQVTAQKVKVNTEGWWTWVSEDPLMNLGYFTGQDLVAHAADTNCFILETNDEVTVTFTGTSLTHTSDSNSKLLTRYVAYLARGVDDLPEPYLFINIPEQIQPFRKIGYFGEAGKAPSRENGDVFEKLVFDALKTIFPNRNFWPEGLWTEDTPAVANVNGAGIYAYQVFGFAGTDSISSQRDGLYNGLITLTVSK